jgi:hypothetical protein
MLKVLQACNRGTWDDFRGTWDDFRGTWDDFRGTWDDFRGTWDDFRTRMLHAQGILRSQLRSDRTSLSPLVLCSILEHRAWRMHKVSLKLHAMVGRIDRFSHEP